MQLPRSSQPFLIRVLLLVILGVLLSGLAVSASAAPEKFAGDPCYIPPAKIASPSHDASKTTLRAPILCCDTPFPFKIASSSRTIKAPPARIPPPCEPECGVLLGKLHSAGGYKDLLLRKVQPVEKRGRIILPEPCDPPANPLCGIAYTSTAVVGSLPLEQQAYWLPGKLATGVTVNAGTYWVNGIGTAEDGGEYYQIVVACQYLFVPVASMQPSFEPPWSGEPLPTTVIS